MKKSMLLLSLFMTNAYSLTWTAVEDVYTSSSSLEKPQVVINSTANRNVIWKSSQKIQASEGVSSWSAAADIYSGSIRNGPELAANAAGDAIVYFTGVDGTFSVTKICEYTNSTNTWDPAQTISTITEDNIQPNFTILPSSDALGVWVKRIGTLGTIQSSFRSGGTWTSRDLNAVGGSYSYPLAGLYTSGDAVSIWTNKSENYYQIFSSLYTPTTWGTPTQASTLFQTVWYPTLSVNPAGSGAAAWTELMGVSWNVCAKILNAGVWEATALISPVGENDQNPNVIMNDNGVAICVWERRQQGILNIFGSIYSGSAWSESFPIYQGNTDSTSPKVALNNNDQAIVTWTAAVGGKQQVFAATYDGTWSAGESLAPVGDAGVFSDPCASVNDAGDVVVVWVNDSNGGGVLNTLTVQLIQSNFPAP